MNKLKAWGARVERYYTFSEASGEYDSKDANDRNKCWTALLWTSSAQAVVNFHRDSLPQHPLPFLNTFCSLTKCKNPLWKTRLILWDVMASCSVPYSTVTFL